jgi:leader peptidase (prepilin peptidase) / N-methyltransferase
VTDPRVTDAFAPIGSWYFPTIAFLFGACIGSFLNVCVSRWPAEQSVVKPRSRCPKCGHEIPWYENIPLVSWIALRARCSGCKNPISSVYPLLELVVALGWLACVLQFGPTLTAFRVAAFGTVLLGIMITDATDYVIPDGFTVFGFFFALVTAGAGSVLGETLPFATLYDSFMGACVGAGAIAIIGWLGELALKKEAMGFGDVTLMAMVGAFLGPGRTLLTIFIGAFLGAVGFLAIVYPITWMRSRKAGIPFAPPLVPFGVFLAPAALIALLWGRRMMDWYAHDVLGL